MSYTNLNGSGVFINSYNNEERAESYAQLEFPNTYYLAYRDLPEIIKKYKSKGKALDFGCGTGRSTRFLDDLGFDTLGVDISQSMINQARKMKPKGNYMKVEDGSLSEIKCNEFDLVLSVFTFDNIPGEQKRERLVSELKRVLKPDGVIILLDTNPELYVNEWASFSTMDFPQNKRAKSGDVVKVIMNDVPDKRPVDDVIWFPDDYNRLFNATELVLLEALRPLAKEDEPYEWKMETKIAPWVIYVLKKEGIMEMPIRAMPY